MWTDGLGNPLSLRDGRSVAQVDDFVEGFIASEARAVNVLAAAESDDSAIVQAYAAALHMFAESRQAPANARPFLDRAQARASEASPREQRFIAAIAAWVQGDIPRAIALHEEQAKEFPRDLVSLKLGQYHLFNIGDSDGMLRIALHAQHAAADVPFLHGMLAFGWEQCHELDCAESAARRAIAMRRKEPWAHHALAHVMLTQGRIDEGREFMQGVSDTWTGLNSFMVTHNWWHQALFALAQRDHDEVLRLYDTRIWGVAKDYSQDQINAVSLLARLELAGVDVGERWQDVADHLVTRTGDHVLPFLDVQYLYGLARAQRPEADVLMRNIERQPGPAWQGIAVPVARGMLAHARGEYARAAEELGRGLPRLIGIGGSHAQRDLFTRVHRDALAHSR
jgi:tetratricopeptide (TPR) repeat protein